MPTYVGLQCNSKSSAINLLRLTFESDICHDGEKFANSFGQLVALKADAYQLAAAVLYELNKRYAMGLEPNRALKSGAFLGIHLRTSADAALVSDIHLEARLLRSLNFDDDNRKVG